VRPATAPSKRPVAPQHGESIPSALIATPGHPPSSACRPRDRRPASAGAISRTGRGGVPTLFASRDCVAARVSVERPRSAPQKRPSQSAPLIRTTHSVASENSTGSCRPWVATHVPGYMGNVPWKVGENIHGVGSAEANALSQILQCQDPHAVSERWQHLGGQWPADRMATHKLLTGRKVSMDVQPLLSNAEEQLAYESNRRLGHTFGIATSTRAHHYRPGDRYVGNSVNPDVHRSGHFDASQMPPAGCASIACSRASDQKRYRNHGVLIVMA